MTMRKLTVQRVCFLNEPQSGVSPLFLSVFDKEFVKFTTHYFQFSKKKLHFQSEQQRHHHALFSNKAPHNKPIRILLRKVHII